MEIVEQRTTIDKSGWPKGPWITEPDYVRAVLNYRLCLILRTQMGTLCGYASVTETSKLYGKHYDSIHLSIHGGLSFAGTMNGHPLLWFFGFDCAHYRDYIPALSMHSSINEYKDINDVLLLTSLLCTQIQILDEY